MRKKCVNLSELIVGLLLILLGIFTFVCPDSMLTGAIVIYGIIIISMGALDIVIYIKLSRFNGFGPMLPLITGILSVMCGVMLLANPNAGKWALTVLLPLWFISHCISGLSRIGLVRLFGSRPYYLFSLILNIALPDEQRVELIDGYFYDIQPRSFVLDCQNRKLYGGVLHGPVRS